MPIYEPGLDALVDATSRRPAQLLDRPPSRRRPTRSSSRWARPRAAAMAMPISPMSTPPRAKSPGDPAKTVVVTKSTVPVGTGDEVERSCAKPPRRSFAVVSNPEFLREGAAIDDFKRPDRIVIGTEDERAKAVMRRALSPAVPQRAPILFTSRRSAELIKYAANAFLATKITFINEIADLCEKVGADVQDVARGIGLDNRIGGKFLHAGPGYGGSCFPKDTLALLKTSQDIDSAAAHRRGGRARSTTPASAHGPQGDRRLGGDVRGKTVALLGLTFKPNTDDMRDAPSIAIAQALLDAAREVRAYDPEGMEAGQADAGCVEMPQRLCRDRGCRRVAIVTEWDAFRALDLERVRDLMKAPVLVDWKPRASTSCAKSPPNATSR
jgi:UDPglucose 6-dehydrogenase